jgi:hypothetical protein
MLRTNRSLFKLFPEATAAVTHTHTHGKTLCNNNLVVKVTSPLPKKCQLPTMKTDGTNEAMPGPNGNNARPEPKMPGTMEQLKSNQREKATFVPLQKIRCAPLPKTRRCVHPSKRRRSVPLQPKKRRRCVPLQQGEKMRSSPKRRRCVHLQNTKQAVFICKKREDVSMCPKKEKMCSSVTRSRCFPLQKKEKMCSSSNFRLFQRFDTVKTSQDSCSNSSTAQQCHGTQATSKRHRLVVIELHTTALGPRAQN